MRSKKELAVYLSKLLPLESHDLFLEQYSTPSELAAELVWDAHMKGDLMGRTILDAGTGSGILGIGALLMGAKHVYFIDLDQKALTVCEANVKKVEDEYHIGSYTITHQDIVLFDEEVDTVLTNPPFGTKQKHADKRFLELAFTVAPVVYSIHKTSTYVFIKAIAKDYKMNISDKWDRKFMLRNQFHFHKKEKKYIDVTIYRFNKP